MPLVDVTDMLVDTDIAGQQFQVLRRQETVDNYGESTVATQLVNTIGSIQPSGDQRVERDAAFDAQAKGIIVVTTFRLRGVSKGPNGIRYKPDIVISDISGEPNMFEVVEIVGWNAFGPGFIEAKAQSIDWIDFAPAPGQPFIGRLDYSMTRNSGLIAAAAGIKTC